MHIFEYLENKFSGSKDFLPTPSASSPLAEILWKTGCPSSFWS
jgi:hypothetical protein